jgi:hypothetical protein
MFDTVVATWLGFVTLNVVSIRLLVGVFYARGDVNASGMI